MGVLQAIVSNLLAIRDSHIERFKGHVTIVTENGADANWLAVTIAITITLYSKIDTGSRRKQTNTIENGAMLPAAKVYKKLACATKYW